MKHLFWVFFVWFFGFSWSLKSWLKCVSFMFSPSNESFPSRLEEFPMVFYTHIPHLTCQFLHVPVRSAFCHIQKSRIWLWFPGALLLFHFPAAHHLSNVWRQHGPGPGPGHGPGQDQVRTRSGPGPGHMTEALPLVNSRNPFGSSFSLLRSFQLRSGFKYSCYKPQ